MSSIQSRWFHASTLVNSTLYITGGTQRDNAGATSISDECLALDLSQPWSIEKPLFMTMPRLSMPLSGHSMNKVPGSTQLLVAGGESTANLTIFPILLFETSGGSMQNIADGTWISPTKPANIAASPYRLYPASITTGKDGVLLHGGYPTTAVVNATVLSSLVTLKPSNNFAPKYSAPVSMALNSPALARHTMTLMPDGRAIILGGTTSQNVLTNLSMAYVMDTQASNASWNIVSLSGKPPDPRVAFSTVLVNTTTLLLYGGTSDFKSAFWVTFYLDLPTMAWSSPMAQGRAPRRWGHTATMAGSTMVVAFGLSSRQAPDNTSVVLLDTKTNTWITEYRPRAMSATNTPNSGNGNNGGNNNKSLSIGAVLGLAFLITAAIVGSAFFLLVRRKKRRTRNTVARENLGQTTTRAALGRGRSDSHSRGIFGRISEGFSLGVLSRNGEGHGRGRRPDSRRYSEFSLRAHPMTIMERISELGYSPVSLGYPESVVQIGTGAVSVTSYVYPNQACAKTERLTNGDEAHIIFHDLSMPQKEALRLTREQEQRRNQYLQHQAPKTELLQFVDDD